MSKLCGNCGNELSDNAKFCTKCGTKYEEQKGSKRYCKKCSAEISLTAKFCPKCGASCGKKIKVDDLTSKTKDSVRGVKDKVVNLTGVDEEAIKSKVAEYTNVAAKAGKQVKDKISDSVESYQALSDEEKKEILRKQKENAVQKGSQAKEKVQEFSSLSTDEKKEKIDEYANATKEKGKEVAKDLKNFNKLNKTKKKKYVIASAVIAVVLIFGGSRILGGGSGKNGISKNATASEVAQSVSMDMYPGTTVYDLFTVSGSAQASFSLQDDRQTLVASSGSITAFMKIDNGFATITSLKSGGQYVDLSLCKDMLDSLAEGANAVTNSGYDEDVNDY